eukprot:8055976-Pyramimonas_sp.AAC.1
MDEEGQMPGGAAVPEQSCSREVMLRVIGDETAGALGATAPGALIDIGRLYESVDIGFAAKTAHYYNFPPRTS